MKRPILFPRAALLVSALLIPAALAPATLAAHGVEVSRVVDAGEFPSETVRFMYSTGEAMSFATIRAYAPSKPDVETVQSITDRNGFFSFVPDEEGEWRISAEDGMGHKGTIAVPVARGGGGKDSPAPAGGKTPLALRVALGLSLILNVFAVYHFALERRAGGKEGQRAH
jgi:nickel transport protein